MRARISAILFTEVVETLKGFFIALSAGGFSYLASSELIPELYREKSFRKSVLQFIIFILGLAVIWSLTIIFPVKRIRGSLKPGENKGFYLEF